MSTFCNVCVELGVPLAEDKTEGPSTRITYLGITIDTEKMQIQSPENKIIELLQKLNDTCNRKKITLKNYNLYAVHWPFVPELYQPDVLLADVYILHVSEGKNRITLSEYQRRF